MIYSLTAGAVSEGACPVGIPLGLPVVSGPGSMRSVAGFCFYEVESDTLRQFRDPLETGAAGRGGAGRTAGRAVDGTREDLGRGLEKNGFSP